MAEKVYFIQAPSGLIKIGRSTDVPRRKKSLQLAHGEQLKLLGAVPGGAEMERAFHERWASLRQSGEWFTPTPHLLADIKRALDAPQLPLDESKLRANAKEGPERVRAEDRLIGFFRERYPSNTAAMVARDTGISEQTVRRWLERAALPGMPFFGPLLMAYGPSFLAAISPTDDLPDWLVEAVALEQAQILMDRIKADMVALDGALAVTRRGDVATPIAEYARSRTELETPAAPKPNPGDRYE